MPIYLLWSPIILYVYLSCLLILGTPCSATVEKVSEEVTRSLKFLRAIDSWKSNAQYLLEIELNEAGE